MSNDINLAEEIAALRRELRPVTESARAVGELKEELAPRMEEAVRALIVELSDVESDFQLEHLLHFLKRTLRNVRNLTTAMEQLRSVIDLVTMAEPLLRQSVPVWIAKLDEMERRGVFQAMEGLLGVLGKLAAAYPPEQLEKIGDGLVSLTGLAARLADPAAVRVLDALAAAPARVNPDAVKPVGPIDLLKALGDPDLRRGLGLALELARALGASSVAGEGAKATGG